MQVYSPVEAPLTETILASGRVVQQRESELGAMIQSTVSKVLVEQGDSVEENQLLIQLVDDEASARVRESEAAVQQAAAALEAVQGVQRKLAAQRLTQARAVEEEANKDYARQKQLFERGAATEVEFERVRHKLTTAQSQRVEAWLELAASAPKGSRVAEAAAALARAQAALQSARVALSRTQVRAPGDGTVLRRSVEKGEVVGPGQVLLVFAQRGKLSVSIHPDETSLGRLKVGQKALVSPEAFADRKIGATVRRIAPAVDAEQGTIEVELELEDSTELRPEMTVSVEVTVAHKKKALVLPTGFVRDLASSKPWVLEVVDGEALRTTVKVGLRGDSLVEIMQGLGPKSLLLDPQTGIEEGAPVRTKPPKPAVMP